MSSKSICYRIASNLQELFDEAKIDNGHGVDHALAVMTHAENALSVSATPKSQIERSAILYAALLHDADDRKFFPNSKNYENARRILETVLPGESKIHKLVIKMVKLVSCSNNGNSIEGFDKGEMWMLIPRMCDRLEASGSIGIIRSWIYSEYTNRPLWLENTPRATTIEELKLIAIPKRFSDYLVVKESVSMIDHFYDKLLHITSPEVVGILKNPYLTKEAHERHSYVVQIALQFGKTGTIDKRMYNKIRVHANAKKAKT